MPVPPFGGARTTASMIALLVGGYATTVLVKLSINLSDAHAWAALNVFDPPTGYFESSFWTLATYLAVTATALLALFGLIALAARKAGAAVTMVVFGVLALLAWLFYAVTTFIASDTFGRSVWPDFSGPWPYDLSSFTAMPTATLLVILLGSIRGARRTAPATFAAAPQGRPTPRFRAPTEEDEYTLWRTGQEFGPYSLEDVRAFAAQETILADDWLRLPDGRFIRTAELLRAPAPPVPSPPAPERQFLVWRGAEYGPYPESQVRAMEQRGEIGPTDWLREPHGQFAPARQIPGLLG
ncbi:MAG: hypothetical protein QM621_06635 [Aeromicrobium sp.]|uniref:hypothetical protein n=1 Tax=Aeromicrobium sp. TaxID=1871063 RepID=UPI0039E2C349